jgi:leader peptidase (prepilin peptidase)/N-methyltransferase
VAGVGVGTALTASAVLSGNWGRWWQAAFAAAAAFVVFYAVAVVSGLGYGDVKLAAVIAGCAGYTSPTAAAMALVGGFVAAGVVAAITVVVGGAGRGSALAMGPWLLLGAAATLALYC